jgi:hypothetical protein
VKDELKSVFDELLGLGLHFDLEVFTHEGEQVAYSVVIELVSIDSVRRVTDIAEARGLRIEAIEGNRLKIDTPEPTIL